jgi:hypothetical protein
MTPLVIALAVAQAAFLLWAAVQLSAACLLPPRGPPALIGFAALGVAIAMARASAGFDPHRILCTLGDCIVLTLCVAGVRIVLLNKEADALLEERRLAAQAAAEAAANARREEARAEVRAAAAALENRRTRTTPPWSG